MSHSDCPSRPDEDCGQPDFQRSGASPRPAHGIRYDAGRGVYQRIEPVAGEGFASSPIQTARADAASIPNERAPFVVQAGKILFLVAEEREAWVLAEWRFDPVTCAFIEDRRTRFQWPREVYGRFLSRAIVGDDVDLDEANRVADAFTRWIASQFVAAHR